MERSCHAESRLRAPGLRARTLGVALLTGLLAFSLAACTGGDSTRNSNRGGTFETPSATATADPAGDNTDEATLPTDTEETTSAPDNGAEASDDVIASVPDVAGLRGDDIERAMDRVNLNIDWRTETGQMVIRSSNWVGVSSDPPAGTRVAEDTTVTVTVRRPDAEVPDVVGMRGDDALRSMNAADLRIDWRSETGEMVLRPSNWVVTEQSPAAGTAAQQRDTITLTVARP